MTLQKHLLEKGLSYREAEVAEYVTKGLSNKDVANALFVTEKTVKFHLTNIYKKLKLKSRAQLIVWAAPFAPEPRAVEPAPKAEIVGDKLPPGSLSQMDQ